MSIGRVTKQSVEALTPGEDTFLWDSVLKGFGVRIGKNGRRTYIVQYRTPGGRAGQSRRMNIGAHGSPWTAELARQRARQLLGEMATGTDPSANVRKLKQSISVDELCDLYLKEGVTRKKASTLASDLGRINRHIRPLLGSRRLLELNAGHIRHFLDAVARGETAVDVKTGIRGRAIVTGGQGVASRSLGLLGGMLSFAIERSLMDRNPANGVRPFSGNKNERFLSVDELVKLGQVLTRAAESGFNPAAINIIRLLMLTGARRGEIDRLRWAEVDLAGRRLRLSASKTGQKDIMLNSAAIDLLSQLQAATTPSGSPFVFPASKGEGHFTGTPKIWRSIRVLTGAPKLRIHDLRHSFASVAVAQGTPLLLVSKLLGHSSIITTQRYAHFADDPVRAASEGVGAAIAYKVNSLPVTPR